MNVRRVSVSALVAAGLLLGLAPGPRAQAEAPETGGQVGALVLLGADQIVGVNTGAISSLIPNFVLGASGAQAADDIIITTATTNVYWVIQQITVSGANAGAPAVSGFNLYLYNDNSGLPGSLLGSRSSTSFSNAPNYVINTNLALQGSPAGRKYWLSVQANVTSTDGDSWNWQSSSSGALGSSESAWVETQGTSINGGLCALSTTGWGLRKTQCNLGEQFNMAFRLDGQIITVTNKLYLPMVAR